MFSFSTSNTPMLISHLTNKCWVILDLVVIRLGLSHFLGPRVDCGGHVDPRGVGHILPHPQASHTYYIGVLGRVPLVGVLGRASLVEFDGFWLIGIVGGVGWAVASLCGAGLVGLLWLLLVWFSWLVARLVGSGV
jgi:hypothetical protein